jgi:hypothetical protein
MNRITTIPSKHQSRIFPESSVDNPWEKLDTVKRFYLSFPFYPFRTLAPRDAFCVFNKQLDYDTSSPLFPANTHINITFKKRQNTNFLSFMIPFKLDPTLGSKKESITSGEKISATSFIEGTGATKKTFVITRVDISVKNIYLQVE